MFIDTLIEQTVEKIVKISILTIRKMIFKTLIGIYHNDKSK